MEVNSFNGQEGVKSSREIELLEAILATLQHRRTKVWVIKHNKNR